MSIRMVPKATLTIAFFYSSMIIQAQDDPDENSQPEWSFENSSSEPSQTEKSTDKKLIAIDTIFPTGFSFIKNGHIGGRVFINSKIALGAYVKYGSSKSEGETNYGIHGMGQYYFFKQEKLHFSASGGVELSQTLLSEENKSTMDPDKVIKTEELMMSGIFKVGVEYFWNKQLSLSIHQQIEVVFTPESKQEIKTGTSALGLHFYIL